MVRYKKLFFWAILGGVFLITLLVGIGLLLPYLINLEPLREKISKTISQQADVKIIYQRLDLSYFPRPHVKFQQVRFLLPEKVDGIVKAVEVYTDWLPLLKGNLQARRIHIESPDLNIRLSKELDVKDKTDDLLKKIGEVLAQASAIFPKMDLVIEDGRLHLRMETEFLFSFSDLKARIATSPEKIGIEIASRSNHWENLNFNAAIEPKSFKGSGRLEVKRVSLHTLLNALFPSSPFNFKESWSDLRISFNTEGTSDLKAMIEASLPSFTLRTSNNDIVIRGNRLKGNFGMKGSRLEAELKEWDLKDPQLKLSGRFQMDRAIPSIHVKIEGRNVDVISTRKKVLAMMGESSSIHTILGYVRGGTLPEISLGMSGRSFGDLTRTERMTLRGRVIDGHLLVPISLFDEPLDVRDVKGGVAISKGILLAKDVEGKWENVQVQNVQLRIGLQEKETPFHMEALIDTDLSQLPPLLRRIFKKEDALQEIDQIKRLEGRVRCTFVLGETLSTLKVKASVRDLRLVAHYGRIPFPLSIDSGESSYEGEKISFRNLKGAVGRSSFSGLTAELNLQKKPHIEVQSGECAIALDELSSWISFREAFKNILKETSSLKGIVRLSRMRMKGPLNQPQKWHFETVGEWQGLNLNAQVMPDTITSPSGKFRADHKTLILSDVHTNILHASLHMSGRFDNYLDELDQVELDMEGKVISQNIQWLLDTLKVKREIPIRSPISFSKAHLSWRKKGGTSFRGNLKVEKGPRIYFNLIQKPGQLKVDPLILQDEASNCSVVLDLKEGA